MEEEEEEEDGQRPVSALFGSGGNRGSRCCLELTWDQEVVSSWLTLLPLDSEIMGSVPATCVSFLCCHFIMKQDFLCTT